MLKSQIYINAKQVHLFDISHYIRSATIQRLILLFAISPGLYSFIVLDFHNFVNTELKSYAFVVGILSQQLSKARNAI